MSKTKKSVKSVKSTPKSDVKESKKSDFKFLKEFKVDFKNFDAKKTALFLIPFILILIVMSMAFYVRSGPISLNGLDANVEANIYNNIQNMISQQIEAQYPNLNPTYKQELVAKEFAKVQQTGVYELNGQSLVISDIVAQNSQGVKDAFKADNGQTYLNAIDPYHFMHLTTNYIKTGTIGDKIIQGEAFISYKVAPNGLIISDSKPEFHVWLESLIFKFKNLEETSDIGDKTSAIFLLPVIFAMLSAIPVFLILRKFSNDLFAFFGSLFMVSVGTFVSRTIAGFSDTDAYNVFFPLIIILFILYGFLYIDKFKTAIFSSLGGFFVGMFLWAWGSGWFVFVFIEVALIGYLGYIFVVNLLKKIKIKELTKLVLNDVLTLVVFTISSVLSVFLFKGGNLFSIVSKGLIGGGAADIASISGNIWPNVLSSVAELNNATFDLVITSVGGKVIFILALLGLVLLALDYKVRDNRFVIANRVLMLFSIIWFYLIVDKKNFVFLAANQQLLFLVVLFIPIGVALLFRLINHDVSNKVFLTMLLSIWVAGTIYMSLNGVRFILLLTPAFAISFGLGLYYLANIMNNFFTKEFKIEDSFKQKVGGFVIMSIVFLVLFSPIFAQAQAISKGTTPNFDDAWYSTMYKIRDNSSENAIITSWWDFGHFFATVAQRGVTFDGGTQGYPQAHWVGKLLMENDEEKAHDILQMIVCGGNNAFDKMYEFVGKDNSDAVKINKVLYETFGKSSDETRAILKSNKYYQFSDEQVDEIMAELKCESPRENFLITSEDMVGKAGVWAHWGSWDFSKKYVYDNYNVKSAQEIADAIDENVTLVEQYVSELKTIDRRAQVENIKRKDLVNQWFAPYPGYVPIQGQYQFACSQTNVSLNCQNGVIIDIASAKVSMHESLKSSQITFKNLVYPTQFGTLDVVEQDPNGEFDVLLIPTQNGFNTMLIQSPLGASLFTKLFYLNGFGTKYFEKFDDVNSVTGVRVITWKVKWDNEIVAPISGTKVTNVEFNATKADVQKVVGENISLN